MSHPIRRSTLFLALALATVQAAGAVEKIRYRVETTPNDLTGDRGGIVISAGDAFRETLDAPTTGEPATHDVLVRPPGSESETALDTGAKTYFQPNLRDGPTPAILGLLPVVSGGRKSAKERSFECRVGAAAAAVRGAAAQELHLVLAYDLTVDVHGTPVAGSLAIDATYTFVPTIRVAVPAHRAPTVLTAVPALDGKIVACLSQLTGLVTRQDLSVRRHVVDGIEDSYHQIVTAELLTAPPTVDASLFQVPSAFRHREPEHTGVAGGPGVADLGLGAPIRLAAEPAAHDASAGDPVPFPGPTPAPAPPASTGASRPTVDLASGLPAQAQAKMGVAMEKLRFREYSEAIRGLQAADKLAGGSCAACQLALAMAYNAAGAFKDAVKSAGAAVGLTTDADLRSLAYNEQGTALLGSAKTDPARLVDAEAAFRQSLAAAPSDFARLNLGITLLRLARDAEGVAELQTYLAEYPFAPEAEKARELVDNPLRARKNLFPDLDFVTLGGEYLTAASLRGKVVLIDFWGTWCLPCRAGMPGLKSIAHRHANDPFVLVSISNDPDKTAVVDFVAKNEMTWPQVWDERQDIIRRCGVDSYPTYLLLDPSGEVIYSRKGWGHNTDIDIARQVAQAVKAARKAKA